MILHVPQVSQITYLKNVESASVATALAKYDFPVPGGPYRRKALHGLLFPKGKKLHAKCEVTYKKDQTDG